MSDRMTDERLAEIEEEVERAHRYWVRSSAPQHLRTREELLQALKAERERVEELKALLENELHEMNGLEDAYEELQRKYEALVDTLKDEGYWSRIRALLENNDE